MVSSFCSLTKAKRCVAIGRYGTNPPSLGVMLFLAAKN